MATRAKAQLRAARQALAANSEREEAAGITRETGTFRRLNQAVVTAEGNVPWWRDDRSEVGDRFRHRRVDNEDRKG